MASTSTERIFELVTFIRAAGGVARATTAIDRGHSQWTVEAAIRQGAVVRIRRVWLAVPDADAELRFAAQAGVVLSCATQARRLKLWVLADDRMHVAAPRHRGRISLDSDAVVHWHMPVVPRMRDDLVDPVENVLANAAACLTFESAVAVWESALRRRLVTPLGLEQLPFKGVAQQVRQAATPFSDSGLESFVLLRTRRWNVRVVPQVHIAGHDVDFLIGDRLVLQVDGGEHVGAQRTSDNEHDAVLKLMGYHVIRVGYQQIVGDWPRVQLLLMRAIGQGLHEAPQRRV